jgi:hydrogenase expression/formation protein HypC
MCLGVPGEVVEIYEPENDMLMGKVRFGGISKEVCLAYTPDVKVGDYVIVHVGFAISKLDEAEANQVFEYLTQMGELAELG